MGRIWDGTDDEPGSIHTRAVSSDAADQAARAMAAVNDPATVVVFHEFEQHDWDEIEAADGDITRGMARIAVRALADAGLLRAAPVADERETVARTLRIELAGRVSGSSWDDFLLHLADAVLADLPDRDETRERLHALADQWEQRYGDDSIDREIAEIRAIAARADAPEHAGQMPVEELAAALGHDIADAPEDTP